MRYTDTRKTNEGERWRCAGPTPYPTTPAPTDARPVRPTHPQLPLPAQGKGKEKKTNLEEETGKREGKETGERQQEEGKGKEKDGKNASTRKDDEEEIIGKGKEGKEGREGK